VIWLLFYRGFLFRPALDAPSFWGALFIQNPLKVMAFWCYMGMVSWFHFNYTIEPL